MRPVVAGASERDVDHHLALSRLAQRSPVPPATPSAQEQQEQQALEVELPPHSGSASCPSIVHSASLESSTSVASVDVRTHAFGHDGPFSEEGFFYKPVSPSVERFANETRMLELCMHGRDGRDSLSRLVPEYYGIVNRGGRRYIKLRDLLADFSDPWLMDIKMGVRCYAEKELDNVKPRTDLFERMTKMEARMGREVLTAEERASQSITKHRWMMLRDSLSSTLTLGFRVDAVLTSGFHKTAFDSELFMTRDEVDVMRALRSFFPSPSDCTSCHPREVAAAFLKELSNVRQAMMESELFRTTEFIGSSLLFAADLTGRVGIWMIDFNVSSACDEGLRHDIPWEMGNREDGYLIGLGNLERLWDQLIRQDEHWQ